MKSAAIVGSFLVLVLYLGSSVESSAIVVGSPQAQSQAGVIAKTIGKIKTIHGNALTVEPSSGAEVSVTVQPNARIVKLAPGQKDLKDAAPLQLQDLQLGDLVRIRGAGSDDGKSISALELVVITASAVAAAGDEVRQDWQKRGIAGIVQSIDTPSGTVTISIPRIGGKREVSVHTSKTTVIRRYAVDSAKPENAKPSTLQEILPGDQLRARGDRSADGGQMNAEEVFVGVFPQFSGTVKSVDANTGVLSVQDLASKKTIEVKVTSESQLHKIPAEMAQAFAMHLKRMLPPGTPGAAPAESERGPKASGGNARPADSSAANGVGPARRMGGGMRSGGGDLQQIVSRLPSSNFADLHLQKGDAVVILSTEGSPSSPRTAITLLSGVEPILQAAPSASQAMMLTPWSLGGAPGGDASQ